MRKTSDTTAREGEVRIASITDPDRLAVLPRRYFMTNFNWAIPRGHAFSHEDFLLFRNLNCFVKWQIAPGDEIRHFMEFGTDILPTDRVIAYLDRSQGTPGALRIESNSVEWKPLYTNGRYEAFEIPAGALKKGINPIRVFNPAKEGEAIVNFKPAKLGDFEVRFFGSGAIKAFNAAPDKSFTVSNATGFAALVKRFGNIEFSQLNIKCKVKITGGRGFIRIANGGLIKVINIGVDKISAVPELDITENFNDYRDVEIQIRGKELVCKLDGKEILRTNKLESAFIPEVNKMFPDASRLFSVAPAVMFGHHGDGNANAQIHFKDVEIFNPPGSSELLNLMVEIDPAVDIKKKLDLQEIPNGTKSTPRGVQGKISAPGKVMASEIVIVPNNKPVYWFISDGKQVAAWTLDNMIVRRYPNSLARIDINPNGEAVTYTMVMGDGEPALYRNGHTFYQTNDLGNTTYAKRMFNDFPEAVSVDEFLRIHGTKFNEAQQDILRNGGCIAQSSGQIKSVKLFEQSQK